MAGCSSRQRTCAFASCRRRSQRLGRRGLAPDVVDERHQHGLHLEVVLVRAVADEHRRVHFTRLRVDRLVPARLGVWPIWPIWRGTIARFQDETKPRSDLLTPRRRSVLCRTLPPACNAAPTLLQPPEPGEARIVPPGPHPAGQAPTTPVAAGDGPEERHPHDHYHRDRAAQGRAPGHVGLGRLRRRGRGLRARRRHGGRRHGRHRAGRPRCSTSPPAPATPRSRPLAGARVTALDLVPALLAAGRGGRARPASRSTGSRATRRRCRSPTRASTSRSPSSACSSRRATRLTARELVRVLRPGGRIVLAPGPPRDSSASFPDVAPQMPKPPAGASPRRSRATRSMSASSSRAWRPVRVRAPHRRSTPTPRPAFSSSWPTTTARCSRRASGSPPTAAGSARRRPGRALRAGQRRRGRLQAPARSTC